MIGKLKGYLIMGVICLLVLLGGYIWLKHTISSSRGSSVVIKNVPYEVPVYYTDSTGTEHAELKAVSIQRDQYKHQLDSISRVLRIKSKDIQSTGDYSSNTNLDLSGDTVYVHDTIYEFSKIDPYYSIAGKISPSAWNISLSIPDTIHTVYYTKSHLFSPNETILDISNSNPYVHILSGRQVNILQKKPLFTIGPYIGYQVYPKEQWSIGISIQHPIITIK